MTIKVDVTQVLKDFEGHDIMHPPQGEDSRPLTVRRLVTSALGTYYQDDQKGADDKKFKRFKLALRVAEHDMVEFTAGEVTTILEYVNKWWSALIYGRLRMILDPEPEKEGTA